MTKEKINKMRLAKFEKETRETPLRPNDIRKFKRIVEKLANNESITRFHTKENEITKRNLSADPRLRSNNNNNKTNNHVTDRLTKTSEELNDYKKIVDNRTNMGSVNRQDANKVNNIQARKRPSSTNRKQTKK